MSLPTTADMILRGGPAHHAVLSCAASKLCQWPVTRSRSARNFRSLRKRGVTVRKTIDLLIGTWCIENRRPLLHNDGDFRPMARHLGLVEVSATA